jgi:cobalt/nickel transport system permease protein
MTPARWLVAYLAAVVSITFVHDAAWLALALLAAGLAAGPARWRLMGRTLVAVWLFNGSVSLAMVLLGLWHGQVPLATLLLLNLRVVLLVFLGFWFVSRVNLLQAMQAWPTAALVATVAVGQATAFARTLRDYRLAFRSRNPLPARWSDLGRHAAAQSAHLLDQSGAAATEVAQAMRSRGCFDD